MNIFRGLKIKKFWKFKSLRPAGPDLNPMIILLIVFGHKVNH